MIKRKRYSKEFKEDAMSLVKNQNYTLAEASGSLDIYAGVLSRWIKEYEKDSEQSF